MTPKNTILVGTTSKISYIMVFVFIVVTLGTAVLTSSLTKLQRQCNFGKAPKSSFIMISSNFWSIQTCTYKTNETQLRCSKIINLIEPRLKEQT